jgi:hypothetical protein
MALSTQPGGDPVLCHFEGRLVDGPIFELTYEDEKLIELYPKFARWTLGS